MKTLCLFLLCICLSPLASAADLVVITVAHGPQRNIQYRLDDKPLNLVQLKDALSEKLMAAPASKHRIRIAVLFDRDVSIGVLSDLRGLILKVGFDNPRYFMTSRSNEQLSEVKVGYRPLLLASQLDAVMSAE